MEFKPIIHFICYKQVAPTEPGILIVDDILHASISEVLNVPPGQVGGMFSVKQTQCGVATPSRSSQSFNSTISEF